MASEDSTPESNNATGRNGQDGSDGIRKWHRQAASGGIRKWHRQKGRRCNTRPDQKMPPEDSPPPGSENATGRQPPTGIRKWHLQNRRRWHPPGCEKLTAGRDQRMAPQERIKMAPPGQIMAPAGSTKMDPPRPDKSPPGNTNLPRRDPKMAPAGRTKMHPPGSENSTDRQASPGIRKWHR